MAVDTGTAELAPGCERPGQQGGVACIAVLAVTDHQARGHHGPEIAAVGDGELQRCSYPQMWMRLWRSDGSGCFT